MKVEKRKLFVAFVDFRKAYNKINRRLLLFKLQRAGIKGLLYKNIKSIYESISYMIKITGGYLTPILSSIGLKQGGVLSSLLFNLYIDDMRFIFDSSCDPVTHLKDPLSHLLYADDLILMSTTHTGLSNCLAKLEKYCDTWQLEVNITKTKIIIFNTSGKALNGFTFKYKEQPVQIVKTYCYLGVEISASNSLNHARSNLMEKARKASFPLQTAIAEFKIPPRKAIKLFQAYIKPIALYNTEILAQFTHHQIKSIETGKTHLIMNLSQSITDKVQNKFFKYILGLKPNCSNMATLGELGELPLLYHGLIHMLSYWHRLTTINDKCIVRQALTYIEENEQIQSEWLLSVRLLLKLMDLDNYFHNPVTICNNKFKELCKEKLRKILEEQWLNIISGDMGTNGQRNKLRLYKRFKHIFEYEPYLDYINDFHLRKIVTKFRCSDHTLEIERGRHKNLILEKRTCRICNRDIESEKHFLQDCPCYSSIRKKYLGRYNNNFYLHILQSKTKIDVFNLSNYLAKALKLRNEILSLPCINPATITSLPCCCL